MSDGRLVDSVCKRIKRCALSSSLIYGKRRNLTKFCDTRRGRLDAGKKEGKLQKGKGIKRRVGKLSTRKGSVGFRAQ